MAIALTAFACPLAGFPVLAWPAFAAGIVSVLLDLDRTKLPPGQTPLAHSPAAAVFWGLFGSAFVLAFAPGHLGGAILALSFGFGSHLALDAFFGCGIFLWPRTRRLSVWLMPYSPESLVQLDRRLFVVPSAAGVVPRPWSGWHSLTLRSGGNGQKDRNRPEEWIRQHMGLVLSAASLAALLAAVVMA